MNVALISNEYPPFNNIGGIATFMASLAKLLTGSGHKVTVFTDGRNSLTHQAIIDGVTITPFLNASNNAFIRAATSFLPCKLFISILQKKTPAMLELLRYNLLAFFTFISYPNRTKFRIIHTPVLFAPAYLISLAFPLIAVVTHAQGPDELLQPYDTVSWETFLKAQVEASYMKRSMFIIPCSQTIRDYLQKKYPSIKQKILFIPNFMDTKIFPAPTRAIHTNTLLFFGRMEKRKGPDLVINAFAKLAHTHPQMKLLLIGEDTSGWRAHGKIVSFSGYVKSLNLPASTRQRITFIPRIDERGKLLCFLSKKRGIAILPSRYEPFGLVYIEAMMTGCITIVSSQGAGDEIVQNSVDGFVIKPMSSNIVSSISKIKKYSQRELVNMSRHAREKVTSLYDTSSVKGDYISLYQDITRAM